MEIWTLSSVMVLLCISLHRVYAQNFQLQLQLTGYQRFFVPNPVSLITCLRDSSTGCDSDCSPEEAQSAILDGNQASELPNTDPLMFPPTMAGDHVVCFEFRRQDGGLIVRDDTELSITMTEDLVGRSIVRPGQVAVTYEFQVQCSGNYFSLTCSTTCILDTLNEDYVCSGDDGETVLCQPALGGGPDLTNCRENAAAATMATTTSNMPEDRGKMTTSNTIADGTTSGNSIDASAGGLSQGEVAGIVIPILLITALVAAGTVAGILVWKYQPWLNKESTKDALENPMYNEMELGGGRPGHNQELSASTYSSPLYSDASVDASENTAGRNEYIENGNLMSIIRMQSARKKNVRAQHPAEANGAAVVHPKTSSTEDLHGESATFGDDDQRNYEPVEVSPTPTFDNPDYEAA